MSHELAAQIKSWGKALGFDEVRVSDTDLTVADARLQTFLDQGRHGSMEYLARNRDLRVHPEKLVPGTLRIITVRMNYLPENPQLKENLQVKTRAYVSRYAVGRDYHKVIRKRLTALAKKIQAEIGDFIYRPFADSAPVFEKDLAMKSGLGWMGKHTIILSRDSGSWFFLGNLYTSLDLPIDPPVSAHCGSCTACIDICPTKAIVGPYQLDARRCISYLTIENKGPIPEEFRQAIGNRIYGCDDCQIICPWNKFAKISVEPNFQTRHQLTRLTLLEAFAWTESDFASKTRGSAIRRISYDMWLRNVAIALGNAPTSPEVISALTARLSHPSELVQEHVRWALAQHVGLLS